MTTVPSVEIIGRELSHRGRLGPADREHALSAMQEGELDVVVVGGGVVGTGAALDAATRGLTVALIEARDFASGTSSRSSKLVHGGLRYLEMLDFGLVREALRERGLILTRLGPVGRARRGAGLRLGDVEPLEQLVHGGLRYLEMLDFALVREALRERGLILTRLAPHLCRPVPFLYPLQHRVWERAYVGSGIMLYDLMSLGGGHSTGVPFHKHLTRKQVMRQVPSLQEGRDGRGDPVLRRPDRRRPPHHGPGPDRRRLRRATWSAAPG